MLHAAAVVGTWIWLSGRTSGNSRKESGSGPPLLETTETTRTVTTSAPRPGSPTVPLHRACLANVLPTQMLVRAIVAFQPHFHLPVPSRSSYPSLLESWTAAGVSPSSDPRQPARTSTHLVVELQPATPCPRGPAEHLPGEPTGCWPPCHPSQEGRPSCARGCPGRAARGAADGSAGTSASALPSGPHSLQANPAPPGSTEMKTALIAAMSSALLVHFPLHFEIQHPRCHHHPPEEGSSVMSCFQVGLDQPV
mmetsp:Transcript_51193/g.119405  ORF Transcript_51193/g.119405 Transcript_51193/m.119405 type:complete len:252 (-) Transcript_51193:273-1028(-)